LHANKNVSENMPARNVNMSPFEALYSAQAAPAGGAPLLAISLGIGAVSAILPFDIVTYKDALKNLYMTLIATYAPYMSDVLGIPLTTLTATPLRPQDVGMNTTQWAFTISSTGPSNPNTLLSYTVPNQYGLVFAGIADSTPSMLLDEIKLLKAGTTPIYDANLDFIQALPATARFAVFNRAFYFTQNETFTWLGYAHATGTEYLAFIGVTFTRSANIINPD